MALRGAGLDNPDAEVADVGGRSAHANAASTATATLTRLSNKIRRALVAHKFAGRRPSLCLCLNTILEVCS